MAISTAALLTAAKLVAQDSTSTPLLLGDTSYAEAIAMALPTLDADRPNTRIIHHTVAASAFRFVLSGSGALAGLTGLDAWVVRRSAMRSVWWPYTTTTRAQEPLDRDSWRVIAEPGLVVLELLEDTPASGILRLEFTNPHVVAASAGDSTILAGDVSALTVLVAAQILTMYASRAIQNTGNTGLPMDVVDRRSHSAEARAVAKVLMERYASMVGRTPSADAAPVSAIGDMDVQFATPLGPMWSRRRF